VLLDLGQGFTGQSYTSLPYFTTSQEGWLVVTVGDPLKPHVDLFTTVDAGESWKKREVISLNPALNPASAIPSILLDGNRWLLAGPGKPAIYTLRPMASTAQTPVSALAAAGLPEGVIQIISSSPSVSWALAQEGDCRGYKPKPGETVPPGTELFICSSSASLWQTINGGASWVNITPPSGASTGN
jgi:hypothetical protein